MQVDDGDAWVGQLRGVDEDLEKALGLFVSLLLCFALLCCGDDDVEG